VSIDISNLPKPSGKRKARNWKIINEKLVQRGEIDYYLDFLISWDEELLAMNQKKVGRPFEYPNSLIFIAKMLRLQFSMDYRSLEGVLRTLGRLVHFQVPDFSTIWARLDKIDLRDYLPQKEFTSKMVLSVDASGIKVDEYSDWMRHKWQDKAKKRRGWIKMHIIVDVESHTAIDVKVTKEDVGDQEAFIPLVQSAINLGVDIKQVQGDGIFDTKEIHNFLAKNKLEPGIPPRKNASRKARGSAARAAEIRMYQDYGEKVWKLIRQYHRRPAVERTFSAFKQLFGDTVMARKWERIVDEIQSKYWILNWNLTRPLILDLPSIGPKMEGLKC
jgi:transposase